MEQIWRKRGIVLAVLLAVALLGVLGWMWTRARDAATQQIRSTLSSGAQLQLQAINNLQARFTMDTARIAEDPAFVAYVLAGRERGPAGIASISDLLEERLGELGADSMLVLTAAGTALTGTGELQRQSASMERWSALQQVLQTGEAVAGWWMQDDTLALVAISPLRQGPLLEGVLLSRRLVDRAQFSELFVASGLDAHVYAQQSSALRPWPGSGTQAPEGALAQQWLDDAQSAGAAGAQLSQLSSLQDQLWLLSSLTEAKRDEIRSEQTRIAVGLVTVAGGLLMLLFWVWRNGRRGGKQLVIRSTYEQAPPNPDQRRGELLQDMLGRAFASKVNVRIEQPDDDQFIKDARYQLISYQGATAVARIYRVEDRQLDRVMLLFLLHSDTPRDTARSLRIATELGKAGLVQHRSLVSVQRVARASARLLVTLDDVSGISLRELLEQVGELPVDVAMLVAKRIAAAQQRLNESGVLLRQIDRDQVLFQTDGAVKLLPLALAGGAEPASHKLAETSAEQWLAADRRSEVLAFGEFLHSLLGTQLRQLPVKWRELLDACTTAQGGERYASMSELIAAIEQL